MTIDMDNPTMVETTDAEAVMCNLGYRARLLPRQTAPKRGTGHLQGHMASRSAQVYSDGSTVWEHAQDGTFTAMNTRTIFSLPRMLR